MKLLLSSPDLEELGRLVTRLVWARIPCAVCREPLNSYLGVWIQRDIDVPLALHVLANQKTPRRLPHWAGVFGPDLPATNGIELRSGPFVQPNRPTRHATACATALRYLQQHTRVARPASWPLPGAYAVGDPSVDDVDLACVETA